MTKILRVRGPALAAALTLALLAPGARGEPTFPQPSELEALGPGPAISEVLRSPLLEVEAWRLEGPFPGKVDVVPHAPASVFESVLDRAVAARAGAAVSSEAMHCVAHEVGRFLLARGSLPASGLLEFMAARCGAAGPILRQAFLQATVQAATSDDDLLRAWRTELDGIVARSLTGGLVAAGLWSGRVGDRAALVVVSGERALRFEPFSAVAKGGAVVIRGEVLEPTDEVIGLVNQGRYGFAECARDPSLELPRFGFRCLLAPADDAAMLEIAARPRGSVLSATILRVLARRPCVKATEYRLAALTGVTPTAESDLPAAVHALVGQVRKQAGLAPLTLSVPQSEQAAQLAPHFFASAFGFEPREVGDRAALGIAAGWRVDAPIRAVRLTSGYTAGSREAERWLDAVLRYPTGRQTLLDPRSSVLAVGMLSSASPTLLAGVAAAYELFGDEDRVAAGQLLLARIERAREARSAPMVALPDAAQKALDDVVAELPSGRLTPQAALPLALTRVQDVLRQPVRGCVLEALRIEDMLIPNECLEGNPAGIAVSVSHARASHAAWGRYVALVVVSSSRAKAPRDAAGRGVKLKGGPARPAAPAPAPAAR